MFVIISLLIIIIIIFILAIYFSLNDAGNEWWFIFKVNTAFGEMYPDFSTCFKSYHPKVITKDNRKCPFDLNKYPSTEGYWYYGWNLDYYLATSQNPSLQFQKGCLGSSQGPLEKLFSKIYNGNNYYVIWNDQFKGDPDTSPLNTPENMAHTNEETACPNGGDCLAPWGHSKGVITWDKDGNGRMLQVTTPNWPRSGSKNYPSTQANSLGCDSHNNVTASQHFFSFKINKDDLIKILKCMINACVVTLPNNKQVVNNGGPKEVQNLVKKLGVLSPGKILHFTLSNNFQIISKPWNINTPPWQLVSSVLGGKDLKTATWWADPTIPSTKSGQTPGCWNNSLKPPGEVINMATGKLDQKIIGLTAPKFSPTDNHAKFGCSIGEDLTIFGDMNQQGALSLNAVYKGQLCNSSQNGRGGMFLIVPNQKLHDSIDKLLSGCETPYTQIGDEEQKELLYKCGISEDVVNSVSNLKLPLSFLDL